MDAARPAAVVCGGGSIGRMGACEVHVRDRRTAETIAHGIRGWDASVAHIVGMVDQLRRERDGFRKAVMRLKSEITDLSARARAAGFDSVSSALYRMAQNLDVKDPYTTALLNQVREVDQEYGTMVRTAGRGLDLPEVYQAIYGNGPRWDGVVTRSTPREESGGEILGQFRSHLYDAEWIDDHRVRFRQMDLGQRLASAWGRVIVP